MLDPNGNSLAIKKFATIKNWVCKHAAGQKCLLIPGQAIDDKEIGSPG
jgi:hypothetical protein